MLPLLPRNSIQGILRHLLPLLPALTEKDKKATLGNISTHTELASGIQKSDLVVEAATENVDLKLKIFKQIDELAPKKTI